MVSIQFLLNLFMCLVYVLCARHCQSNSLSASQPPLPSPPDLHNWKCPQEARWMLVPTPWGMNSDSIPSKISPSLMLDRGIQHQNRRWCSWVGEAVAWETVAPLTHTPTLLHRTNSLLPSPDRPHSQRAKDQANSVGFSLASSHGLELEVLLSL